MTPVMRVPDRHTESTSERSDVGPLLAVEVRAAGLLEEACAAGPGNRPILEAVRELAGDLHGDLEALAHRTEGAASADVLVEAALAGADLATLAACNLTELPGDRAREVAEAVRTTAEAVRNLSSLVEERAAGLGEDHAGYAMRDARGSLWRVDLASRQAEEFLASGGSG